MQDMVYFLHMVTHGNGTFKISLGVSLPRT